MRAGRHEKVAGMSEAGPIDRTIEYGEWDRLTSAIVDEADVWPVTY